MLRGPRPGILSEVEIMKIIDGWDDSEDEFGDGIADEDCVQEVAVQHLILDENLVVENEPTDIDINQNFNIEDMEVIFADDLEVGSTESCPQTRTHQQDVDELQKMKEIVSNLRWRNIPFEVTEDEIKFKGDDTLPSNITKLQTTYEYFKFLFNNELLELIITQSNLYAFQKNINNAFNITVIELQKFIGICLLTSVVHISNTRKYWSQPIGNQLIQQTMSVNKFEKIKQTLHFNDNDKMVPRTHPGHDRIHKIRPLVEMLQKFFGEVPYEQYVCVDEQMCSTKARHYIKQYMPAKPHKWGYKFFILAGISGYCYNFELFTGQENNLSNRLISETNIGSSGNVVIRLTRNIPKLQNYKCYFDNYYSSIPLVIELAKNGILSLGTLRKNRISSYKLPDEKTWKLKPRGASLELSTKTDNTNICVVSWKDVKIVNLISNFIGEQPLQHAERHDRKNGPVSIPCPAIVLEYNKFMGGVDLLDSFLGRYKIKLKSKKWYLRVFFHLLDLTVSNSWILYRKVERSKGTPEASLLTLADFKVLVAETLCMFGERVTVGRPSTVSKQIDLKRKKPNTTHIPPKEIRNDKIDHFPEWMKSRLTCKIPGCGKLSFIRCLKCSAPLCLNKDRNCFLNFHK